MDTPCRIAEQIIASPAEVEDGGCPGLYEGAGGDEYARLQIRKATIMLAGALGLIDFGPSALWVKDEAGACELIPNWRCKKVSPCGCQDLLVMFVAGYPEAKEQSPVCDELLLDVPYPIRDAALSMICKMLENKCATQSDFGTTGTRTDRMLDEVWPIIKGYDARCYTAIPWNDIHLNYGPLHDVRVFAPVAGEYFEEGGIPHDPANATPLNEVPVRYTEGGRVCGVCECACASCNV